jgi:hypothetical protein
MLLKLLLEVKKESTGLLSGRASRDGWSPWRRHSHPLFSLDTGHGTFPFSAAKKHRHQMAVDWKNQCAPTSTRMLLTFSLNYVQVPPVGLV